MSASPESATRIDAVTTSGTSTTSAASLVGSRTGQFHPLTVSDLEPLTDDSVAVTLSVPAELVEVYRFGPGQHLTLRAQIDGEDVRRSYSLCSAPYTYLQPDGTGRLRVAVKLIEGGAFSGHAHDDLTVGDILDVMTPAGRFGIATDPTLARRHVAVVAGSGITPVLSVMSAVLHDEPKSTFTLVYGNRDSSSVMFAEEIADAKDRWTERLQVLHVLSREPHDAELLHGRIDEAKLSTLLSQVVPPDTVDHWYLCGPFGLVEQIRAMLAEAGVAREQVHQELFHVDGEPPPPPRRRETGSGAARVQVRLDGRSSSFAMPEEGSVLDAVLTVRADAPFACKGGVCGTCRAKVISGEVEMARNYALEQDELDAGYVLACQSVPVGDELVLDFDA